MKKILLLSILLSFVTVAVADIQSPPGKRYNSLHKLGRGLANIFYGFSELPATVVRNFDTSPSEAFSAGVVKGASRSAARFGWGFFEVFTFPTPTTKGSYRQPYSNTIMKPVRGFEEFPPEVGYLSGSKYVRQTLY